MLVLMKIILGKITKVMVKYMVGRQNVDLVHIFIKRFILVRVKGDLEPILGTLGNTPCIGCWSITEHHAHRHLRAI